MMSKAVFYCSFKLKKGASVSGFETMEDVKKFESDSGNAGELAKAFYSFINCNSCKVNYYTIEKSYEKA